jgi:predicted RNA-binding Zn ribbon-like protein
VNDAKKPFQLVAGSTILDFVNTLDNRFADDGPLELFPNFAEILRFSVQSGLLTTHQAERVLHTFSIEFLQKLLPAALALRELIARIFYAVVDGETPDPDDLDELSRLTAAGTRDRRLAWSKGKAHWVWPKIDAGTPLAMLALEATELLASDEMSLLRDCNRTTCRWLFLDTSKNHTRRWCDMKVCGNRTKATRYYGRMAAVPASKSAKPSHA